MNINANQLTTRTSSVPQPRPDRTPLQRHVDFFDRNSDGLTTMSETYQGLRALGVGRFTSALGAAGINLGLAHKTGSSWTTIHNDNIHLAKHDSDSDVYDVQGNLDKAKFQELFDRFDTNKDGGFNKSEIDSMLEIKAESKIGKIASGAEFGLLLKVAGQPNAAGENALSKERMQPLYDGRLFYELEKERA